MRILNENSNFPQQVALILGFFDGVHAGHCDVIKNTPDTKKVIVTFSSSPAEYFKKDFCYIYPREYNYELLENLGVDYIYEQDFAKIAELSADEYLKKLINIFNPKSITTGFNHTFGAKRQGNSDFLKEYKKDFIYYCTAPTIIDNEVVSSTRIKNLIVSGEIEKANQLLQRNFSIKSTVIEGNKLGRKLGFPTANMEYPDNIVKLPYGVYKVKVLNQIAVMNWGIKPTIGAKETLEIHIPNFNENLYNKTLEVEILSKIRNEKKFNNLEELKQQIEKDIEVCLK